MIDQRVDVDTNRGQLRIHNEFAQRFVKEEMVEWERDVFAETLETTLSRLDAHMEQQDFLNEDAMMLLGECSGLGLTIPRIEGCDVTVTRKVSGEIVEFIWTIHQAGELVGCGLEDTFGAAITEVKICEMLFIDDDD